MKRERKLSYPGQIRGGELVWSYRDIYTSYHMYVHLGTAPPDMYMYI